MAGVEDAGGAGDGGRESAGAGAGAEDAVAVEGAGAVAVVAPGVRPGLCDCAPATASSSVAAAAHRKPWLQVPKFEVKLKEFRVKTSCAAAGELIHSAPTARIFSLRASIKSWRRLGTHEDLKVWRNRAPFFGARAASELGRTERIRPALRIRNSFLYTSHELCPAFPDPGDRDVSQQADGETGNDRRLRGPTGKATRYRRGMRE